jgi:hypothetical protein
MEMQLEETILHSTRFQFVPRACVSSLACCLTQPAGRSAVNKKQHETTGRVISNSTRARGDGTEPMQRTNKVARQIDRKQTISVSSGGIMHFAACLHAWVVIYPGQTGIENGPGAAAAAQCKACVLGVPLPGNKTRMWLWCAKLACYTNTMGVQGLVCSTCLVAVPLVSIISEAAVERPQLEPVRQAARSFGK